jgi:amino acid transporter
MILVVFALVAFAKVYSASAPPEATRVALNWFNPFDADHFTEAVLAAVFIYWGWDCGVSVNEETTNSGTTPGRAAVLSTFVLLAVYVLVGSAAVAFAGPDLLAKNGKDIFAPIGESVLGPHLSKLLIFAVLTSACASTLTTILPNARTALSMAGAGALPKRFGHIHPHYLSPSFSTLLMGAVSIVWYVVLTTISSNVLDDSVLALGVSIAFYYGLTGIACVIIHRRELFESSSNFLFMGVLPGVGGLLMLVLFVNSCFTLGSQGSTTVFGIATPLVIGIGGLLIGFMLLPFVRRIAPAFFRR